MLEPMTRDPVRPLSRRERRAQARLEAPPARRGRNARRAPRSPWQSPPILVTGAAIVLGLAIIAFARPAASTRGHALVEPPTVYTTSELAAGDVIGSPTAPVVLQLYSDFQCPACRLFVTTELPSLINEFVRPGLLRIEAQDIDILGTGSPNESLELAVGAACAAEQDRYWPFHDLVFWNQGRENKGDHDAAFIADVATAAEVDLAAWNVCAARTDLRQQVAAQTASARSAGINQTPTLVVNGQRSAGVPDYATLAALIRELASASPS